MQKKSIPLLLLCLFIVGCDNADNHTNTSSKLTSSVNSLSLQNEADIRTDLKLINTIINNSNNEAITIRNSLSQAMQNHDKESIKSVIAKSKKLLETTNSSLAAMNIKSQEVEKVRTGIIDGNNLALKLQEISSKTELTSEDKNEIALLQKQSIEIQKKVGQELDSLNKSYN
ncbi:hypothetical protein RHO13_01250 [Orbus wheelerorum]|uniref:hypothetical protein n=1 Tax=Orbus wheelerorum TaxID=3074111 RepID=UPI00370D0570